MLVSDITQTITPYENVVVSSTVLNNLLVHNNPQLS